MSEYNVTVSPTVVGPNDRVLLVLRAVVDSQTIEAIAAQLEAVFGPERALIVVSDVMEAFVVEPTDEAIAEAVEGAPDVDGP